MKYSIIIVLYPKYDCLGVIRVGRELFLVSKEIDVESNHEHFHWTYSVRIGTKNNFNDKAAHVLGSLLSRPIHAPPTC